MKVALQCTRLERACGNEEDKVARSLCVQLSCAGEVV